MPMLNTVLQKLDGRIPKVIDARTHGIVDYCHASFFLSMAVVCRKKNPRAAAAALGTGLFVLVQSLVTDYPLGATKLMSFETHGKLDAGFAALNNQHAREERI